MAETERRRRRIRHNGSRDEQPDVGPKPVPRPAPPARAVPGPPAAGSTRAGGSPPTAGVVAETAPVHDPEPAAAPAPEDRETERGLRGLVGAGSSQVSAAAAMRARDASRPSEADLAAAEQDLVIIRRGWVPRDPLTR